MLKKLLYLLMLISYTLSSQIIYVDQNATGSNNGTDWANAYTNLQTAIANIGSNTTINVAQGTYYPTATTDRTISFNIPSDKKLYGGFPTSGGTRNPDLYPTILSGDIGTLGVNTDNSYHVVYFYGSTPSNEFDGFTVEKGYADGSGTNENLGGGILVKNNSSGLYGLYLRNCVIRYNFAVNGGGIAISKKADIYNCKIYSNQAEQSGGGINIDTDGRIYNSYIANNSAQYAGGIGVGGFNTAPKAIGCVIANNEASVNYPAARTNSYLINCTIVNNKGGDYGVRLDIYGGTFNSIIWGNEITTSQVSSASSTTLENNLIQDFTSTGTNMGISNANDGAVFGENYPRFTKPTSFTGNATNQTELDEILNADWSINPQSAAIDFGDNSKYPTTTNTPTVDIIGNNRTINSTMDAGAYEALTNIITTDVTNQQPTSADLNGEVLFAETTNTITRGFVYATSSGFDVTTATSVTNSATGLGTYSDNITGLTENQLYYYRTWVQFDGVKYYGNEIQFKSSNLVAYYPFNGNANDESGNNHNGTVNGPNLTTDRFGNANSAYHYHGNSNNDFIDIGDWENGGPMTIHFWIKWEVFNNWGVPFDIGNGNNSDNIGIGNESTYNVLMFYVLDGSTKYLLYCNDTSTYPNSPLTLNDWTMITCTVDETGLMKAFKNGELIGTYNGFTPTRMVRTAQYLGSYNYPENGYFQGDLDDVRIYNKALTNTEVLTLYNTGTLAIATENLNTYNFYVHNSTLYFKNTQNLDEIKNVEVFNLLGQKVFKTSKIEKEIPINNLQKGIYILKVTAKNSNYNTLKFISY